VKPPAFTYHRPRSLEEALDVLAELDDRGKVLAGGQSLVPLMSMRLSAPEHLVDVNHVPGLGAIDVDATAVRIGATARHSQVERHEPAHQAAPLLRQALRHVAHPTIRNRGTTVGSLVHGDPAAEMPAVLLLLDGAVTVRSAEGSREVPAADFFTGPMETAVRPGELAVSATFRRPVDGTGSTFVEVARRHGDYAVCGVGAVVTTTDGQVVDARLALVSMGAGPVRVDVLAAAAGAGWDPTEVAQAVDAATDPETDIHASADYRRHLSHVLAVRALDEATQRARGAAA
jgi:aerobic carbon-monoxide dehydrogenase medium subunit